MNLFNALTTGDEFTENGMVTNSTSSQPVLDLFFKMGGWNASTSDVEILNAFVQAYRSDRLLATKSLFYHRDVREGQGRRDTFRKMFRWLCNNHPEVALANLENVPYFGRWDDILYGLGTPITGEIIDFIFHALKSGDKLCAKWMPRENKSEGYIAKTWLIPGFGITPKQYRKLLAGNTEVVEHLMCKREWGRIDYNKVPSKAINNYKNAFYRNDEVRFSSWVESLKKNDGTAKINAGAIYPHDIVRSVWSSRGTSLSMVESQWNALPNYMPSGRKILPVCDVSGSMRGEPMDVCVALGLYLSERNEGPFKDGFITFSNNPKLQILRGSLVERIRQLNNAEWSMSTNLEAVFAMILDKAVRARLSESDMPNDILILSDMQFNECVRNPSESAMDMIRRMYRDAGFRVPNVIFWNLRTSSGVPAKFDERGTALISGFSPSIMKHILGGSFTPVDIMMNTLASERYSRVK